MQNGSLVLIEFGNPPFPILSFLKIKDKFVANEFIEERVYLIAVSQDNLRQREVFGPKVAHSETYQPLSIVQFNEKYQTQFRKVYEICSIKNIKLSWLGMSQAVALIVIEKNEDDDNILQICKKIYEFQENTLPELKDPFQ